MRVFSRQPIDVIDEEVFRADVHAVFEALLNELRGVTHWWSPTLEAQPLPGRAPGTVGAKLRVKNPGALLGPTWHFIEELEELAPDARLRLRSLEGDFVGDVVWTVEPTHGSQTRVRFRWHVRPYSFRCRMMTRVVDVTKTQSRIHRQGFDGLRAYLATERAYPRATAKTIGAREGQPLTT